MVLREAINKKTIKEETARSNPVLNNIKLESYITWEIGYVLYKDNMKVANKHNTKEILKPTFMAFTIGMSIFFISKISLLII